MSGGEEEGYWASKEIFKPLFRRSETERKLVTSCQHKNDFTVEMPRGTIAVIESVEFPCGCFARIRPDIE